jgi:hypothetical protein
VATSFIEVVGVFALPFSCALHWLRPAVTRRWLYLENTARKVFSTINTLRQWFPKTYCYGIDKELLTCLAIESLWRSEAR